MKKEKDYHFFYILGVTGGLCLTYLLSVKYHIQYGIWFFFIASFLAGILGFGLEYLVSINGEWKVKEIEPVIRTDKDRILWIG